jgi:hypothetical protein
MWSNKQLQFLRVEPCLEYVNPGHSGYIGNLNINKQINKTTNKITRFWGVLMGHMTYDLRIDGNLSLF